MQTIFVEMPFWIALTRHLRMKTTFKTKYIINTNMFRMSSWWFFLLHNIKRKYMLTHSVAPKIQFYEFCVAACCISLNMHFPKSLYKFEIFIIKIQGIFAFNVFGLKCFLNMPICHVKAVQDNISPKNVSIWLHHTVCLIKEIKNKNNTM